MKKIVDFNLKNNSIFRLYLERILGVEVVEDNFVIGRIIPETYSRKDDIFLDLNEHQLADIKTTNKFIIIDSRFEGWSTIYHGPYLTAFYRSCKQYNIDPTRVVYVTCNLREPQVIKEFTAKHNIKSLHVFAQPFAILEAKPLIRKPVKKIVGRSKWISKNKVFKKYVLSLSNLSRQYRTYAQFMLATSTFRKRCMISHNEPVFDEFDERLIGSTKQWKRWKKKQPTILDNSIEFNPEFYKNTIFNIVNETFVEDWQETSREYSEKTFQPMIGCQPLLIYGQKGANTYLKNLGFKTYEDWFDLEFDSIEDPIDRYKGLLKEARRAVEDLETMSRSEKAKWRFKNRAVIEHNLNHILNYSQEIDNKTREYFDNFVKQRLAEREGFEPSKGC